MFLFTTETVIAWAAVAGVCLAILGAKPSAAVWLISPAIFRWVVLPMLLSLAHPLLVYLLAHWWLFLLLALIAPIVAVGLAVRLVEATLKVFLGPALGARTAGHMFGVWGVRFTDWILGRRHGRQIPAWEEDDAH